MQQLPARQQLEQVIIGTVLLCNCYPAAANIVTEKNFSVWGKFDYSFIWSAFKSMHPTTVIDLITINKLLPPAYVVEMSKFTNRIAGSDHLQQHCYQLFELDLRDKFTATLAGCEALISISDLPSATAEKLMKAVDQVKESIADHKADIITTITDGINYLSSLEAPEELTLPLIQFTAGIDKRMVIIKKQLQLQSIFIALEKLAYDCTGHKLMALRELAFITGKISLQSEVSEQLLININKIKKSLQE